jgi:Domain of Unknown Function (DUF1080)
MSKVRLPECGVAIGALSLLCLLLMADRSEGGPAASRLFNGTTLAGWHVLGAGGWRVANGAMVGSAKNHETNWLVLDRSYEDFIVGLEFQCTACEAGILVRNAPVKAAGNRTSGVYVAAFGRRFPQSVPRFARQ